MVFRFAEVFWNDRFEVHRDADGDDGGLIYLFTLRFMPARDQRSSRCNRAYRKRFRELQIGWEDSA